MTVLSTKYEILDHSNRPYSAIIYIYKDMIMAENDYGQQISSAIAGSDDAKLVQAAIDYVYDSGQGNGEVIVKCGSYSHATPVTIQRDIHLKYELGSIIVPSKDVNLFQLKPNSSFCGAKIETWRASYTKSCIFLDGSDKFSATYNRTVISNIWLKGNHGPGTGTGIYFGSQNSTSGYIYGVVVEKIHMDGFEFGIRLYRSGGVAVNWINGNQFNNVYGRDCLYFIHMGSSVTPEEDLDGNVFENIDFQSDVNAVTAITIGGRFNRIDSMIWDWAAAGKSIVLQSGTGSNYIITNKEVQNNGYSTNQVVYLH